MQTDNQIRPDGCSLEVVGGLFPNIEEYLKKFKVHNPKSLFEPDFKFLQEFRCPICYRRLYWNVDKTIARCKSVKKDKFFIRRQVFLSLGGSIKS